MTFERQIYPLSECLTSHGFQFLSKPQSMSTGLEKVRIEDESSVGRSYSKRGQMKAGLGAARRALRTSTFHPEKITTKAVTLHKINHRTASREDVMEAFHNSWELTDCLFTSLKDDSVFYMIPDKLRRPLIFYFGHTAALYANKFNFVGLTGECV